MLIYHLYLDSEGNIERVQGFCDNAPLNKGWKPYAWTTPLLFAARADYDKLIIHAYKGDQ